MKPLRILHIIPMMGLGGAEKMLGDICLEMHRRGHIVKVVTLHKPHYSFDKYPSREAFVSSTALEQVSMTTAMKPLELGISVQSSEFERVLHDFRPDIIHSHLFQSELLAHSVHYPQAAYFTHFHDNMFQLESLFRPSRQKRRLSDFFEKAWIMRKYSRFDNHFIAISKDTLEFALRVLPSALQKNVSLLRNAFNYHAFGYEVKRSIQDRQTLRIVSVGNLVPKKNHKLLVEVCSVLHKKGIPFQCDILGFGALQQEIQKQIEQAGLQDHVFLRGSVPNVALYLRQADIYVHPASYEPFGLVILEAMAAGLPVICRNGRGNLDIHEEDKTGYLIDGDDAEAFAGRIIFLMQHPDKYARISEYNKTYSRQFDIAHYCDRLTEIYLNAGQNK